MQTSLCIELFTSERRSPEDRSLEVRCLHQRVPTCILCLVSCCPNPFQKGDTKLPLSQMCKKWLLSIPAIFKPFVRPLSISTLIYFLEKKISSVRKWITSEEKKKPTIQKPIMFHYVQVIPKDNYECLFQGFTHVGSSIEIKFGLNTVIQTQMRKSFIFSNTWEILNESL